MTTPVKAAQQPLIERLNIPIFSGRLYFMTAIYNPLLNGENVDEGNLLNGESALDASCKVYCRYSKVTRDTYENIAVRNAQSGVGFGAYAGN